MNRKGLRDALEHARAWTNGASAISPNAHHHMEEESLQMFLNGKAAFLRTWSNEYVRLKKSEIPFGVAPLPRGLGDKNFGVVGSSQFAVPQYSRNQRAATEFIRYLTSPDVQKLMDSDAHDVLPFWKNDRIRNIHLSFVLQANLGTAMRMYQNASICPFTQF